jgi:ribonuclease MRP protein subunit SNM1
MAKSKSDGLQAAFLENSSRYLAISSPSTSAHLMTERIALSTDGERAAAKGLRDNVCNACGTLMILGWNATMGHEHKLCSSTTQKPIRKRQRRLIQVCQVCHRETVIAWNAVKGGQPTLSHSTTSKHPVEAPATMNKGAEKTSGKQRAKARKEKSGLQALLNKSKQTSASSSTFKLDLMDFMKA